MHEKIVAIIVTYNRLEKLKLTVQKSLAEPFEEVLVINNASTDGTHEWLDKYNDKRLLVEHLNTNMGGAGGFYRGFLRVISQIQADWLVCYDDDAYPQENAIHIFLETENLDKHTSVASAVYLPNGQISSMNIPRKNIFKNTSSLLDFFKTGMLYIDKNSYNNKQSIAIDMSSFVGYFLRIDLLKKHMILPKKDLFIYADDLIYTLEWSQTGNQHIFMPHVHFIHDTETLEKVQAEIMPLWKVYYLYRNGIELYRHLNTLVVYPFTVFKYIQLILKIRHYDKSRRNSYIKLVNLALKDGLTKNFSRTFNEIKSI